MQYVKLGVKAFSLLLKNGATLIEENSKNRKRKTFFIAQKANFVPFRVLKYNFRNVA
jgi:hypothetical protein